MFRKRTRSSSFMKKASNDNNQDFSAEKLLVSKGTLSLTKLKATGTANGFQNRSGFSMFKSFNDQRLIDENQKANPK